MIVFLENKPRFWDNFKFHPESTMKKRADSLDKGKSLADAQALISTLKNYKTSLLSCVPENLWK